MAPSLSEDGGLHHYSAILMLDTNRKCLRQEVYRSAPLKKKKFLWKLIASVLQKVFVPRHRGSSPASCFCLSPSFSFFFWFRLVPKKSFQRTFIADRTQFVFFWDLTIQFFCQRSTGSELYTTPRRHQPGRSSLLARLAPLLVAGSRVCRHRPLLLWRNVRRCYVCDCQCRSCVSVSVVGWLVYIHAW